MNIVRLALAYVRRRPLSTALVVMLLALGVAVVTLTLLLTHELQQRLYRDAAGIDLVVGAKGSPLQLVLAGVYHVDVPPGNIPLTAIAQLRANPMVASVIPLSLGDNLRGFRIVGTEHALIALYGAHLAHGAPWTKPLEAVLGSEVARTTGQSVGETFTGAHGLASGGGAHEDAQYHVTGILAPSGTVLDRLVLTGIDSVWEVHAHHEPAAMGAARHDTDAVEREVTMALVQFKTPLAAAGLARSINKDTEWVAASPAFETARLLTVFGAGVDLIRAFALVLMGAAALMLFVALAQALEDRRYDLAILRTLGATRWQVAGVLMIESLLLASVATVVGVVVAHGAALAIGRWLPDAAPLAAAAWRWLPMEWAVVALALGAGILCALWPAWR
ncbi:MAG: FtsX-like permease family protein, partial [Betaproteobacteria bacterium]